MDILCTDEIYKYVYNKLNSGWAVLTATSVDVMVYVENELYAPGTKANTGFEIIGFPHTVALCKRTKKFNKKFNAKPDRDIYLLHGIRVDGRKDILFDVREVRKGTDTIDCFNWLSRWVDEYVKTGRGMKQTTIALDDAGEVVYSGSV